MTCILFKPHKLEQLTFCPFGGLGWGEFSERPLENCLQSVCWCFTVLPALILLVWVLIKFRYDENGDLVDVMGRFNYIYVIPILAILAVSEDTTCLVQQITENVSSLDCCCFQRSI